MPPVLLVDNEASICRLLRLVLTRSGYDVVEARNGPVAIAWLRERYEPAVVVISTMMPHAAIEAVLHALTVAADAAPCACVLLTATPEHVPPTLRSALAEHAVPVVGIPFAASDVLAAVAVAQARIHASAPVEETVREVIDPGG